MALQEASITWGNKCRVTADLLTEVRDNPIKQRSLHGKHYPAYEAILDKATSQLESISPEIPRRLLLPWSYLLNYMDVERSALQNIPSLSREEAGRVVEVSYEKDMAIESLIAQRVIPDLFSQVLPEGLLDDTPYHKPSPYIASRRACVSSASAMILGALTDMKFDAICMQNAYHDVFPEHDMDEEQAYMTMTQTKAFKDKFGQSVRVVELFGVDFNDIANITSKLKSKNPQLKIYCMLSVQSEKRTYAWHNIILLSADQDYVKFHDNALYRGMPYRELPKNFFAYNWGKTYLHGQLVVARAV